MIELLGTQVRVTCATDAEADRLYAALSHEGVLDVLGVVGGTLGLSEKERVFAGVLLSEEVP